MYSITEATQALASVDLVEGLPIHEIHTRLEVGLRLGDTGQGILAFYLAEMADLERSQVTGHRVAVQYAEGHLGMDRRRAGELIAAGQRLRELPLIHQAFCETGIGWSKVIELIKVVTPEHEEAWLERAKSLNCRELRREVALAKVGSKPRKPGDLRGIREPRFPVRATLDKLQYELLENAKRKLGDERGMSVTDAEFLDLAARLVLGSEEDGSLPGRKPLNHSLYQIVLHEGGGETGDPTLLLDTAELGLIPIESESAAIRCDAGCTYGHDHDHVHDPSDRETPPWMRMRVLQRDGKRCRACGSTRSLEVHHITFREHGGPTRMWNLLVACNGCHSLIHANLLVIEGQTQKKARFVDAAGKPLSRAGELVAPEALLRLKTPSRTKGARREKRNTTPTPRTTLANVPETVDTGWWRRHLNLIRCRDGNRLELVEGEPRREASCTPEPIQPIQPIEPLPATEAFGGLVGQDEVIQELAAAAKGSHARGVAHSHTLFVGPAGTGKTTLARGVAKVAGQRLVTANGPLVQDATSLLELLTQLGEGDLLFIDEIHAVPRPVLELLYEAMTDQAISLTLHVGLEAKAVRLRLPRFTLLAATTAEADLKDALRSRFGTRIGLGLYATSDLADLVRAELRREGLEFDAEAARLVAEHARGTPRSLLRLLDRVLNDVFGRGGGLLDEEGVRAALRRLGYDAQGLDRDERRYLEVLKRRAGPVALAQLACALRMDEKALRTQVEPELLERGLVSITPRGRVAGHPAVHADRAGHPARRANRAGRPAPRKGRAGHPAQKTQGTRQA